MKKLIQEAIAALTELEQAIETGDQRKIGASLFLLSYTLQRLLNEAQP